MLRQSQPPSPVIPTFRETAAIVHARNGERWQSARTRKNRWQRAERYIFPVSGDMPMGRIGRTEVVGVLDPVWTAKLETASRLRLITQTVLAWAMAHGHIVVNPAGEIIEAALPSSARVQIHFRALPHSDVGAAIMVVENSTSISSTKLALKFLVLTAARSGSAKP